MVGFSAVSDSVGSALTGGTWLFILGTTGTTLGVGGAGVGALWIGYFTRSPALLVTVGVPGLDSTVPVRPGLFLSALSKLGQSMVWTTPSSASSFVFVCGGMASTEDRRSPIWTVAEDTSEESRRCRSFARLAMDGGGLSASAGEYVVGGSRRDDLGPVAARGNNE